MELVAKRPFVQVDGDSRWSLGTERPSDRRPWDRFLTLDGEPIVHIGNICGTCEFFFRLLRNDVDPGVLDLARKSTEQGISDLASAVVDEFGALVPRGRYEVALFEARPRRPSDPNVPDYFEAEQAEAWGDDHEENQPPRDYYRAGQRKIGASGRLFELLVPLQATAGIDPTRLTHYRRLVRDGIRPTAVALGVLDVKQQYDSNSEAHWVFANYLIDGHHKVEAAALEDRSVTLLSFVALDHSWPQVSELLDSF